MNATGTTDAANGYPVKPTGKASVRKSLRNNFRNSGWRFFVLAFGSFYMMGNYYVYDQLGQIQNPIQERMGITSSEFGLFDSFVSWPNILLPAFGGVFLDKIGYR